MTLTSDPVCGMQVDTEKTPHKLVHEGTTYFFCAKGCLLDFQDEPERYLAPDYKPEGMHDMEGMAGH